MSMIVGILTSINQAMQAVNSFCQAVSDDTETGLGVRVGISDQPIAVVTPGLMDTDRARHTLLPEDMTGVSSGRGRADSTGTSSSSDSSWSRVS